MKKIIINLIIFIFVFLLFDVLFAYKHHVKVMQNCIKNFSSGTDKRPPEAFREPFKYSLKQHYFEDYWLFNYNLEKRLYLTKDSHKHPILVFGCSFAEGAGLNTNQNFEYYLNKLTNRIVYNGGFGGMGPEAAFFTVSNPLFYKHLENSGIKNPEYAIYIYIPFHELRIYDQQYCLNSSHCRQINYKIKNNELIKENSPFLFFSRFYIVKHLARLYYEKFIFRNAEENLEFYFIKIREELQKKYPDIKMIIIKHPWTLQQYDLSVLYKSNIWNRLQEQGFIIYDIKEKTPDFCFNTKYMTEDSHPNEEFWKNVTPVIAKDLKL